MKQMTNLPNIASSKISNITETANVTRGWGAPSGRLTSSMGGGGESRGRSN